MGDDYAVVEEFLGALKSAVEASDTAAAKEIVQKHSSIKSQSVMDKLAMHLFQEQSDASSDFTSEIALKMVHFLASVDPSTYLAPASKAVCLTAQTLANSPEKTMAVSPELLQTLLGQLTMTENVSVSENATMALVACAQKLGPSLVDPAIQGLVAIWRSQYPVTSSSNGSNKQQASTVAVRCASAMIDLLQKLHDLAFNSMNQHDALSLFLQMMTDDSDPLLQLSILDLLEQLTTNLQVSSNTVKIRSWLSSKPVLGPLLGFSGVSTTASADSHEDASEIDPLLGGSALRLLSAICSQSGLESVELLEPFHKALFNFSVQAGSGEVDRLHLVHAVSNFCTSNQDALLVILDDPTIRQSWLSLEQISQPKLKAAILLSVAMVIDPSLETVAVGDDVTMSDATTRSKPEPQMCMKLYALLGQENNAVSTTEWMLQLCSSPMVELRLASYTLLAAVAESSLSGAQVLLGHAPFLPFLLERSESSQDAQVAKFQIVKGIYESTKGLLSDEISRKLEEHVKQGPYFVKARKLDVAVE